MHWGCQQKQIQSLSEEFYKQVPKDSHEQSSNELKLIKSIYKWKHSLHEWDRNKDTEADVQSWQVLTEYKMGLLFLRQ